MVVQLSMTSLSLWNSDNMLVNGCLSTFFEFFSSLFEVAIACLEEGKRSPSSLLAESCDVRKSPHRVYLTPRCVSWLPERFEEALVACMGVTRRLIAKFCYKVQKGTAKTMTKISRSIFNH